MAVWLDDQWDEHPKVQLLPDERAGLMYVRGLLYCQRNPKARGRIPKAAVAEMTRHRRPHELAKMLTTDHGAGVLWEEDGAFYRVHDFEVHNERSLARSDELDEQQKARRAQAQKAAEARWSKARTDSNGHGVSMPGASGEHAASNAPASDEHMPGDAMRTRGRASDPSPSPNAPSRAEPPAVGMLNGCADDAAGDAQPVPNEGAGDGELNGKPQVIEPELDRWLDMWPTRQQADAGAVWAELLQWFDQSFLGEVVGHCLDGKRPTSPRYLRVVALDWARQRGILPADHEAFRT